MKVSKAVKAFLTNASKTRLSELRTEIEKEIKRREIIISSEGAKMGKVVKNIYYKILVDKTKFVKDKNGMLYKKRPYVKWTGKRHTYFDRLFHDNSSYSFIMDYANKKKIKLKVEKW